MKAKPRQEQGYSDVRIMPPQLRQLSRDYLRGLAERTRKVPCPRCGAPRGKPCMGSTGRTTAGCHWDRSNEAKRRGLVGGRWFDCAKHNCFP